MCRDRCAANTWSARLRVLERRRPLSSFVDVIHSWRDVPMFPPVPAAMPLPLAIRTARVATRMLPFTFLACVSGLVVANAFTSVSGSGALESALVDVLPCVPFTVSLGSGLFLRRRAVSVAYLARFGHLVQISGLLKACKGPLTWGELAEALVSAERLAREDARQARRRNKAEAALAAQRQAAYQAGLGAR